MPARAARRGLTTRIQIQATTMMASTPTIAYSKRLMTPPIDSQFAPSWS